MADEIPDLLSDTEEGFADLALRITEWSRTPEGGLSVTARALSGKQRVGVRIVISPDWKPATLGDTIRVFWGTVSYLSVGEESDRLVDAIATAYGVAERPRGMVRSASFRAVALEGNPLNGAAESLRMKLLRESEAKDEYAEFYTNIDVPGRLAAIREKDPAYRRPLLAAISRAGA
jgi:hypothetical protein